MKTLAILLLTAIVAIEKEQCSGKYLLVEIDDAEGRGSFYTFFHDTNMILNHNVPFLNLNTSYRIQILPF